MPLPTALLEILVDPEDKEPLLYFDAEELLYNPRRKLAYTIREGIPVLLINEARTLNEAEADRLDRLAATAVRTGVRSAP